MLKHPLSDRAGRSRVSDVWLERVPGQAHQSACGSGFFVISSAEATDSSVRQLHHDRVVPGKSHNAQTSALRPVQVGPESQMCGSRECLVRLTRALVEAVFP